jgi:GTP-binding protein Era
MNKPNKTFVSNIAFVGLPNVGKSTLLNALVGTKIAPTTHKPQTTRRAIRGIKTVGDYQQIYFDTPGHVQNTPGLSKFMYQQLFHTVRDVDQVVVMVDAQDPVSKNQQFLLRLKKITSENGQPLFLVINKIDAIKEKAKLLELISSYSVIDAAGIIPISALKKDGLDLLFTELNKAAEPAEFMFPADLFTDATEKEIVGELIREKAMIELSDELPYRIAVVVEEFNEDRRENTDKPIVEIEAMLYVERDSQKAIVIGKRGDTIKQIGIRARKDIEHLLDCQVMLKLQVKVEPDWTTSVRGMRKLGY